MPDVRFLASTLTLGGILEVLRTRGGYDLVAHHQQGEFHHDTVLRIAGRQAGLPGDILVVATNCNGGVKEVVCFADVPTHAALWHHRCPDNPEFGGDLPPILDACTTEHWFDPCALLGADARSELLPEFRERQPGGGWRMRACRVRGSVTS